VSGEAVVDRVVEDVFQGLGVLLFRLDHSGPEPFAEDVVASAMTLVESAGVLAVEIAHAVGEVRERRLDDQVVVVPEQAASVQPPAVAAADVAQELDEDGAVPVVEEDRGATVPLRADVVVRAGGEITVRSSHDGDRTAAGGSRTAPVRVLARPRDRPVTCQARDEAGGDTPPGDLAERALARRRLWSARGAGATGSSRVRGAACVGTAFPSASSPGSARRRRRAHRPRSAPR
jgi:hypothetical protein